MFSKKFKLIVLVLCMILVMGCFTINTQAVSTVLLAVQGAIVDGNLIKFSGINGIGVDAGVSAINVVKCKFDATSAPTGNDDVDEGYTVGSYWYDVTADKGYVCLDNTDGAAVWIEITSLGTTTFTGLTDTPEAYDDGKYAKSTAAGLVWDDPASYTNLTSFVDQTAWRLFYSNTDGDVVELALGDDGKYLMSNGGAVAPTWELVSGESNTASNIGSEMEIFKQKTGVDLEFRTLKANSDKVTISITPDTPNIDIGDGASDRASTFSDGSTVILKGNPANASGVIGSIEVWANETMTGLQVGTFFVVSGDFLTTRDWETIGTVTAGSKQTFEVDITVEAGDYIGFYYSGGKLERATSGAGIWWNAGGGDQLPCTNTEFGTLASTALSVYGEGYSAFLDYIKVDLVETEMDVLNLLSTTTVAFNADADTTLYTVPTGKRCVLSHAIVVAAGDAGATTTVSIGQNTAETDFVPANTLSNLDAEYDSVILMPIPNTTPLKIKSYVADTVIEAQVANQSGVAGNTIYLFGILY